MKVHIKEAELLQKIAKNDTDAFKVLFDNYWETLYAIALKRLHSQQECEDIIQEIFIDIWNRRQSLTINTNLSSYLHSAVKYHIFKNIKQRKYEQDVVTLTGLENNAYERTMEFEELYHLLEIALEKLPEKQQLIFKMSRFEGLKSGEIAEKLQISEQTVHNNLHRSLKSLRKELQEYATLFVGFL